MLSDEKNKRFRRKQYLIDKRFQNRVIWRFVSVVIGSIVVSHLVTVGFMLVREWITGSSEDLMYFSNPANETLAFTHILDILWMPMLFSALLGCTLIVLFGLFYSHRIAGPIFNLKRMMRQVEEGHLNVVMRIRVKDEFHDVESAFNQMVQGLRSRLEKVKQAVDELPEAKRRQIENLLVELKLESFDEGAPRA
jgi:methyl-accepting chemotaxis protein